MKLIIGLGNPGKKYEKTRHNVGFMCLDSISSKLNIEFKLESKFEGFIAKGVYNDKKYILLKPTTYMNLSGNSVIKVVNYFNINIEDILVIYDDLDLDVSRFRLREKGSSGGHNGIKSIIEHLKTNDFKRLKIGISKNKNCPTNDHVLGEFMKSEIKYINEIIDMSFNVFIDFLEIDYFLDVMTKYNTLDKTLKLQ